MELLSPAGSAQKLHYAYLYGADAAYMGMGSFSLRARSSNAKDKDMQELLKVLGQWPGKKFYGAVNAFLHEARIQDLREELQWIKNLPINALIISDLGTASVVKEIWPEIKLHLSTQANCLNSAAVNAYASFGFSRIVLGREATLDEIRSIKDKCGSTEIEVFAHGAMCMSYSGRCFLSKHMTDRSANEGDCAHSCRWQYKVLEEEKRPGEYFPVETGEGYTAIMSPKDLNMIDYLAEFKKAGVDSLKIEGRMKSLYYTAITTRAYRKAIDALENPDAENPEPYKKELSKVSHRAFSTGFYLKDPEAMIPANDSYHRTHQFLGSILEQNEQGYWLLEVKNQIREEQSIEFIGPDVLFIPADRFELYDENLNRVPKTDHGKIAYLKTGCAVQKGYIIRDNTRA